MTPPSPAGSAAAAGEPIELTGSRRAVADKFDLGLPGNQRKLNAAGQLLAVADEAGVSLTHLALAFAGSHWTAAQGRPCR